MCRLCHFSVLNLLERVYALSSSVEGIHEMHAIGIQSVNDSPDHVKSTHMMGS